MSKKSEQKKKAAAQLAEIREYLATPKTEKAEPVERGMRTPEEIHRLQHPVIVVVVQARDGKWVYGPDHLEEDLRSKPKGDFKNSADASEAAAKDHQIIINTAPPDAIRTRDAARRKSQNLGVSVSQGLRNIATEKLNHQGDDMETNTKPAATIADELKGKGLKAAKSKATKPGKATVTKKATTAKKPVTKATPKSKAKKASSGSFDPAAKITLLVKENPKRPGTKAYDKFKKYKTGMTVATFLEGGGRTASLDWDTKHKYIKVGK